MTSQKMKDADMPLRDRIEAAIERIKTGQGQMRVPVEATDPDVVLFDCLAELDAARAKDAEAHARELAAKDAEIADLTRKLHWFTAYTPCHWTKGEIEYTTDCGQIAFPASKTPDGKCHGCGRPIVVS